MFRYLSFLLVAVLALAGTVFSQGGSGAPPTQPNFVVIVWDDLSHEDLAAIPTRTLDLYQPFARDYQRAYVCPICSPTRFMLQAGRYPHHDFVGGSLQPETTFDRGLNPSRVALAEVLHSQGYQTSYFGKWHLNGGKLMDVQESCRLAGYETWRAGLLGNIAADGVNHFNWTRYDDGKPTNETAYTTRAITDAVLDYFNNDLDDTRPFYMQVAYAAPHEPYNAAPASMLPAGYTVVNTNRGRYESALVALDTALGELVQVLGPRMSNTYVVLMADNGTPQNIVPGSFTSPGYKLSMYEGGIRVPFFVWGVNTLPGVETEMVSAVDWPATVLELSGVCAPVGFEDSMSFAPTLDGTGTSPREYVWAHRFTPNNGVQPVLSLHRWAVVREDGMKLWHHDGVEKLFDVIADPNETTNLIANPAFFGDLLDLDAFRDSVLTPATWPY